MQPFLLEFVDSKAFEWFMIGLAVAVALGGIASVVGLVALGHRLRTSWRQWKGLDEGARAAATRHYLVSKAKTLSIAAVAVGAVELFLHQKQRAYEHSPANAFYPAQNQLRDQVPGEYTLRDTLLPARARAAQQGQDGWSPSNTSLPPATLVQLVVQPDGTFTYTSKLPTDYTPTGEGTWQWLSLTGHADKPATYGPVFYFHHAPTSNLWAVREATGFAFFGTYKTNEHEMPFALKRQASSPVATP